MLKRTTRVVAALALVAGLGGGLAACGVAGAPGPANPSCAGTTNGRVITTVWSTVLGVPTVWGPRYGVGDPARANRIAYWETRCQAGEVNGSGCVGLFQLCGHGDAWWAAYGQNGCALQPTPGNPWCDAWAGYILWWNGGNPSWSPWNGDPGNY